MAASQLMVQLAGSERRFPVVPASSYERSVREDNCGARGTVHCVDLPTVRDAVEIRAGKSDFHKNVDSDFFLVLGADGACDRVSWTTGEASACVTDVAPVSDVSGEPWLDEARQLRLRLRDVVVEVFCGDRVVWRAPCYASRRCLAADGGRLVTASAGRVQLWTFAHNRRPAPLGDFLP